MLWLIAAVAPVVALAVRSEDPERPLLITATLVVTGLAVAAARRARAWQVAAQIGLTACVLLLLLAPESDGPLFLYLAIAAFAATIVAPLLVRNALGAIGGRRRGAVKAVADVAWSVGLNTGAFVALVYFMAYVTEPVRYLQVRPGSALPPVPRYGPSIEDVIDSELGIVPASLEPSARPFPWSCEAEVRELPVLEAGAR
jgi:hypothetical protein